MSSEEKKESHSRSALDYKWSDVKELSRFVTETGKILPRKYTRLTAKQQRHIARQIKRARNMLVMQ